jgi:hypothetical protein
VSEGVRLCTGTYTPEFELDEDEGEDATDEAVDAGVAMLMGIEGDITDEERR